MVCVLPNRDLCVCENIMVTKNAMNSYSNQTQTCHFLYLQFMIKTQFLFKYHIFQNHIHTNPYLEAHKPFNHPIKHHIHIENAKSHIAKSIIEIGFVDSGFRPGVVLPPGVNSEITKSIIANLQIYKYAMRMHVAAPAALACT